MASTLTVEATSLRVLAVRNEAQFDGLAAAWNRLAQNVPFRTWEWARTWWTHYGSPNNELFILLVMNGDELVGVAPWHVTWSPGYGKVVRFLGSGEVCSDYLTLLSPPGMELRVANVLADWLANEGACDWHLLDLDGVERSDPALQHLADRLSDHGHTVNRQVDLNCWRASLPGDWKQFLATLSKSRRERTRALLRKTFDAGRATIHRVETPEELSRAYQVLIDLHQKRRRSLSQAGCFSSSRFTEFHRAVASRFLAEGRLRLLWTELEGRPMTAEYGFVGNHTVYYYQGGFEPDLSDESPGWLAQAVSLKLAIEEGYKDYDFLRGDEPYKQSWEARPRPLMHLRIVGRQTSARVRYATWRGGEFLKRWARPLLPRGKE